MKSKYKAYIRDQNCASRRVLELVASKWRALLCVPCAEAGDVDAAAAFSEVILYTVRDTLPSSLLRQPQVLSGKVVIDCNKSEAPSDFRFIAPIPSLAERRAADSRARAS